VSFDRQASRLLIVGNADPVHVGAHLLNAARTLRIEARLADTGEAFAAPRWRRRVDWWLRGHRPSALRAFSDSVVRTVQAERIDCVLTTGLAPLDADGLAALGRAGVKRLNFLTDDPWNPEHRAPWFSRALHAYDHVFTPRRANVADLMALHGPSVSYLPFAYAPELHFPESPSTADERRRFGADLVFAGGADRDRIRAVAPFIEAGFDVALYGGYWDRHKETRAHARGFLSGPELRKAISAAAVSLCLVRRANRDGHAMRTYEVAAMGGCMLVEDTPDHRELFGDAGEAVLYFRSDLDAVDQLRALLADAPLRTAMSLRVRERIRRGDQTYAARLRQMLTPRLEAEVA
jgi:hypothetical protein